jgi:glutamyl-tRNA reductase
MFENWLDSLTVVPTIISMQKQAENIRKVEADKVINKLEEKLTDKEI